VIVMVMLVDNSRRITDYATLEEPPEIAFVNLANPLESKPTRSV
jgi:hypothetical protein